MKCLIFLALCAFAAVNASASFDISSDIMDFEWNEYLKAFNKSYGDHAEYQLRQKYYLENRYNILKHNAKYEEGKRTNSPDAPSFQMGVNKYCKLTGFDLDNFRIFH